MSSCPPPADPPADVPAPPSPSAPPASWARTFEVLRAFTLLGLTSFGGPVAHLGYFRTEFVQRRRWLSDAHYADLVALCQFLPGPASSQVGMAIGLLRAGWPGALAAWLGFTLPSAALLIALALGLSQLPGGMPAGLLQGLQLVAVAVVAQAVWGMGRSLCPDRPRQALALGACMLALLLPSTTGQLLAIAIGACLGWRWGPPARTTAAATAPLPLAVSRRTGTVLLLLCVALGLLLPMLARLHPVLWLQAVDVFYRAGALVFGGGHVVLPLLEAGVVAPGWVPAQQFVAGYAAAQAVPGPLFTLAAALGAWLPLPAPWQGWPGGLLALVAIFTPAFLLVAGALPWWEGLRQRPAMQRALSGINAAVVGLLAAALYHPVWTSAIHQPSDLAWALLALVLLTRARVPAPVVVLAGAGLGWWLG